MGIKYRLGDLQPGGTTANSPQTPLVGGDERLGSQPEDRRQAAHGFLLKEERITHSYPHCWRCKNPVIFRGTAQWFISMQANDLRRRALEEMRRVQWIPPGRRAHLRIWWRSRPRLVYLAPTSVAPITVFYCRRLPDYAGPPGINRTRGRPWSSTKVQTSGSSVTLPICSRGYRCPECGGDHFSEQTLDLWFDSGVSHAAVLERHPGLADLYLEGSDQHRGWFHTSLLTAVGTRDKAPYRSVLTHGFTVDAQGRKMSKSLGNVVAPQEGHRDVGAKILCIYGWRRRISTKRTCAVLMLRSPASGRGHRRIRNTCRLHWVTWRISTPRRTVCPTRSCRSWTA